MSDNVLPFATDPYGTWDEGILALCKSMADRQRLPAVLRRLERTAERLPLTLEDLCVLALVSPVDASLESILSEVKAAQGTPMSDQPSFERSEWGARLRAGLDAIEAPIRAREEAAEAAFGPGHPCRILGDTLWGIVASAMVDASDRLDAKDPFRRLGTRLGLWFVPSSERRWLGIPLAEDDLGIRDLLRRLVSRLPRPGDDDAPALRLLRIATGTEAVPHSADGLAVLLEIGEASEAQAARVLLDSLLLNMMNAIGWDHRTTLEPADVHLAISVKNRISRHEDASLDATASLSDWLRQGRRAAFLPDLSWFLPDICFHLKEWPEGKPPALLTTVMDVLTRHGFAAYPQGPFPLNYYSQFETERELPARLAQSLPEAHDLLRLLSLRSGDWAEDGGELGTGFWGDPAQPDDGIMDLRTACERALNRGDTALADMLIGCWLMFVSLGTQRSLPHVPDLARIIRRIPPADRLSIDAVLGLGVAELAADPLGARRLAPLLSYLPLVIRVTSSEPEEDFRAHLGEEAWEWLSAASRKVLLENEHLFRDWRRLGAAEANARGPAKLLPHWAAVFEPLLRRALRRCDRAFALEVTDRMPLGELLGKIETAWKRADDWPADDDRRRHLVGAPWLEMLEDLNRANTRWGKHLVSDDNLSPGWHDVAALRSRVIFGGALRRCLEAAGKPPSA
ncbi:hypothetical protein [Falsiroseomonas sp. E2-1-a4]|uniref:hypothetical protein n=1 Tax=Falsiroseomonas sp. E2-1-a4 TaxID=3239299 RepID=UPI003F3C3BE9